MKKVFNDYFIQPSELSIEIGTPGATMILPDPTVSSTVSANSTYTIYAPNGGKVVSAKKSAQAVNYIGSALNSTIFSALSGVSVSSGLMRAVINPASVTLKPLGLNANASPFVHAVVTIIYDKFIGPFSGSMILDNGVALTDIADVKITPLINGKHSVTTSVTQLCRSFATSINMQAGEIISQIKIDLYALDEELGIVQLNAETATFNTDNKQWFKVRASTGGGSGASNTDQLTVASSFAPVTGTPVSVGETVTSSLSKLQGQATSAASSITSLSSRMASAESNITSNSNNINTLQGQVTSVSSSVSSKQDKIIGATVDDLAIFDSNGNTKDSGVRISDVTQMGNSFNSSNELLQLGSAGEYPSLDGDGILVTHPTTGVQVDIATALSDAITGAVNNHSANVTSSDTLVNILTASGFTAFKNYGQFYELKNATATDYVVSISVGNFASYPQLATATQFTVPATSAVLLMDVSTASTFIVDVVASNSFLNAVPSATAGDIPTLTASGSLQDSGKYFDDTVITNNNLWSAAQISAYVISQLLNVPSLPPVHFATTTNDTLTGTAARDTYIPSVGEYGLVKDQAVPARNSIYRVTAGAWVRQVYNSATNSYQDITTETTYSQLNINGGVVNVMNGNANKNLQFQFYIPNPSGLISTNGSSVFVSSVTKLPVASPTNRFVDISFGNNTNNNGSSAFPYATLSRAMVGLQYPATITVASSGAADASSISFTSANQNLLIQGQNNSNIGGQTALSGQFTFAVGSTRNHFRDIVLSSTGSPFSYANGALCRNHFENITVSSLSGDWLGLHAGCQNWISLDNIMFANSLATAINLPAFINPFTVNIYNQTRDVLQFTGTGSANTVINISASTDGLVWIPRTFLGTINYANPAWGSVLGSTAHQSGLINSQAELTSILDWNTDTTYDGWYVINFPSPTAFAQNAIIGKTTVSGVNTWTYWGRTPQYAPSVITDRQNATYYKGGTGYTNTAASGLGTRILPVSTSNPIAGVISNASITDADKSCYVIYNTSASPITITGTWVNGVSFPREVSGSSLTLQPSQTVTVVTNLANTSYAIEEFSPLKNVGSINITAGGTVSSVFTLSGTTEQPWSILTVTNTGTSTQTLTATNFLNHQGYLSVATATSLKLDVNVSATLLVNSVGSYQIVNVTRNSIYNLSVSGNHALSSILTTNNISDAVNNQYIINNTSASPITITGVFTHFNHFTATASQITIGVNGFAVITTTAVNSTYQILSVIPLASTSNVFERIPVVSSVTIVNAITAAGKVATAGVSYLLQNTSASSQTLTCATLNNFGAFSNSATSTSITLLPSQSAFVEFDGSGTFNLINVSSATSASILPQFPKRASFNSLGFMFIYQENIYTCGAGADNGNWLPFGLKANSFIPTSIVVNNTGDPITGWKDVYYNYYDAFALTTSGRVFVVGNWVSSNVWREVLFPVGVVIDKIFGYSNMDSQNVGMSYYAIDTTGKLYTWGYGIWGQLGLGNTNNQTTPQLVSSLSSKVIVDVSVSASNGVSVIALDNTGQIYTWGYNSGGGSGSPMGNGVAGSANLVTPFAVSGFNNVTQIVASGDYNSTQMNFTRILRSDGTTWATGYNGAGALGIGTTNSTTVFTQESLLKTNWVEIGMLPVTYGASYAIDATGTLYYCGRNHDGALGDGTGGGNNKLTFFAPTGGFQGKMVQGSSTIKPKVVCLGGSRDGRITSAVLDNTGKLYTCGLNSSGQAALGNYTNLITTYQPVIGIPSNRKVIDVIGIGHNGTSMGLVVLLDDGTMMSAGNNSYGALGTMVNAYSINNYGFQFVVGFSPLNKQISSTTNNVTSTLTPPSTKFLWNTWINGATLTNENVTNAGTTGSAGFISSPIGYGYGLTYNITGSKGSIYWQLPNIDWNSNNPIRFKTSNASVSANIGAAAGDGPFIYVGGSTSAAQSGSNNAGLGVWLCWYTGTPKVVVYNGSTELYSQVLYSPDWKINSTIVFETASTHVGHTNWYDLEMVITRYGTKRILTVLVNDSMVLQLDVSSWTPLGGFCTAGAQTGSATSYQWCRSFEAIW